MSEKDEALEKAKELEKDHVTTEDELEKEDIEFLTEAERAKKLMDNLDDIEGKS